LETTHQIRELNTFPLT